ncbi:hypothetical protein SCL_0606 [Sulfuricaulis limicola]|uniref:DUF2489 domain-containing protein n=1 Tax=Sulfuricaulis limicola TaxID=1620215 RepID=A0A1B4XDQ9_9GAMM|nr:hypothetical protein SCL_0606 [Sulfuricaulis limicola]
MDIATNIWPLLQVIIGGTIASIGGWTVAVVNQRMTRKHEQLIVEREKLENLVSAIFDLELWLKKEENCYLFSHPENLEPSPAARITTIAVLYFPDMEPAAAQLMVATDNHRSLLMDIRLDMNTKNLQKATPDHVAILAKENTIATVNAARQKLLIHAKTKMKELLST